MARKSVSFKISEDEYKAATEVAAGPEFKGVLSDYLYSIFKGRDDMVIEFEPDYEAQRVHFQQEITKLEGQIEKLQTRLDAANQKTGLAGIERQNGNVKQQIQDALNEHIAKTERENLQKAYDALVITHGNLIEAHKRLEEENEEFAEAAKTEAKIANYMKMGSETLGALLESSPTLKARYEQGGLAGLAGFGGMGNTLNVGSGLSEDQQDQLKVGNMIYVSFKGDLFTRMMQALAYMRDNPGVLISLTNTGQFNAYIAQRTARASAQATA